MAQRYLPGYSRDRSPPPRQPDRYEGPRPTRGSFDGFRGRGRGYGGRGDFRGDLRDREPLRDGRNSPLPFDNDRPADNRPGPAWRDERDFERRRTPPLPAGRGRGGGPPPDFRDFRDGPPSRDEGIGRGRGGFGRGAPPLRDTAFPPRGDTAFSPRDTAFTQRDSAYPPRDTTFPPRGRGGFAPRGRGGWDDRFDRRRESFADAREPFRPRSRSRSPPGLPRADRWERPPLRDREPLRHDEWRPPPPPIRRDIDRGLEHGEIKDRFRNDRAPSAIDPRRTSAPSSRPATPHGPPAASAQTTSAPRPGPDVDRELINRRVVSVNTPAISRENRQGPKPDYPASRIEASRGRYTSGASSPVPAPAVPAYGTSQSRESGQEEGPQWNVWVAPQSAKPTVPPSPVSARSRFAPRSPSPALQPVEGYVRPQPVPAARKQSPPPAQRSQNDQQSQRPQGEASAQSQVSTNVNRFQSQSERIPPPSQAMTPSHLITRPPINKATADPIKQVGVPTVPAPAPQQQPKPEQRPPVTRRSSPVPILLNPQRVAQQPLQKERRDIEMPDVPSRPNATEHVPAPTVASSVSQLNTGPNVSASTRAPPPAPKVELGKPVQQHSHNPQSQQLQQSQQAQQSRQAQQPQQTQRPQQFEQPPQIRQTQQSERTPLSHPVQQPQLSQAQQFQQSQQTQHLPQSQQTQQVPRGPKADRFQEPRSNFERRTQNFLVPPREPLRSDGPVSPLSRTTSLTGSGPGSMQQQQAQNAVVHNTPPLGPRQHPNFPAPTQSQPQPSQRSELPPSAPQSMRTQGNTAILSPQPSPNFAAPLGPRGSVPHSVGASPNISNNVIPTGPKAIRGASQGAVQLPGRIAPSGPAANQWQWGNTRPAFPSQQMKPTSVVPAKRDAQGDEKSGSMEKGFARADTKSSRELVRTREPSVSNPVSIIPIHTGRARSVGDASAASSYKASRRRSPSIVKASKAPLSPAFPSAPLSPAFPTEDGDEDGMMLDEDDIEKNEAEYQKRKAALEVQLTDLSVRNLRGASPIERLAFLGRMIISDIIVGDEEPVMDNSLDVETRRPDGQLLTPKTEDAEDETFIDAADPPTPAIGSPELKALPFLREGPITPLSENEVVQDTLRQQDAVRLLLQAELKRQNLDRLQTEEDISAEYADLYRPWRKYVDQLDRENPENSHSTQAIGGMTAVASTALDAAATAAVVHEGRRGRATINATDYDIHTILQESVETAAAEAAARDQQSLAVRPDMSKEAVIPALLTQEEIKVRIFADTSRRRPAEDALRFYALMPPKDDFTEEEHEALVERYHLYPKKFGTIADALPGRNYKECINHYYTTKWQGEYKPRDKRKKGRATKRGPPVGRNKTNALMSNLDEEREEPAVTESGRPRRAAAPTFGEKDVEEPAVAAVQAPVGRKAKVNGDSGEKPKRQTRAPKLGPGRKPRIQAQPSASARQSASPEKQDPDLSTVVLTGATEDMRARELEVANNLAAMQAGRGFDMSANYPLQGVAEPAISSDPWATPDLTRASTQGRGQNSSYWSRPEHDAFPALLRRYGTNWMAMSEAMGTKTQTMLKNYYNREVLKQPMFETIAADADKRNLYKGQSSVPRTPSMNQKQRRNDTAPMLQPSGSLQHGTESPPRQTASPQKRIFEQPLQQTQHYPSLSASLGYPPSQLANQVRRESILGSPSTVVAGSPAPLVEARRSLESLRDVPRVEARSTSSSFLQHPVQVAQYGPLTHQPPARQEVDDYRSRQEAIYRQDMMTTQNAERWQTRSRGDETHLTSHLQQQPQVSQQQAQQVYHDTPRQPYSRFDPIHDRRLSGEVRLEDRRFLNDPRDARANASPQLNSRPVYGHDPSLVRGTATSPIGTPQSQRDERRYSMAPPPRTASPAPQQVPVKQEIRKTSNLSAILNADEPIEPSERRPVTVREPDNLNSRVPVHSTYPLFSQPSRPESQIGMCDDYATRPLMTQQGGYGPPTSSLSTSRGPAEVDPRELQSQNHGRSEWQPRPAYNPLGPNVGVQPTPYQPDRSPESRPPYTHRTSLSSINNRFNASPPPSVYQRESRFQPHPAPPAPLQYHQQVPHQASPQVAYQSPFNQPLQTQPTSGSQPYAHQRQASDVYRRSAAEEEQRIRRDREQQQQQQQQAQQQYLDRQYAMEQEQRMARPADSFYMPSNQQYGGPPSQGPSRSYSTQYESLQGAPLPAQHHRRQQGSMDARNMDIRVQQEQPRYQERERVISASGYRDQPIEGRAPASGPPTGPGGNANAAPGYGSRPGSTFGGGYGQPPPQGPSGDRERR